ncbi:MAG: VCBS repeat-containing protein [Anaerolineae bacterium]|nr:VCBS repeat-containing protein [Anaerolineae bacterium]
MFERSVRIISVWILVLVGMWGAGAAVKIVGAQSLDPPTLKWTRGGCYASWCEMGWYSSPAVADLDGNGTLEVVGASYSIFVLNGADGTPFSGEGIQWPVNPEGGRVWPGVVVVDLEGDGDLEVVTAHGGGYLHIFDYTGNSVRSLQPTPDNELRSLAVYDLEGDGDMEILVASTRSDDQWFVYEHDGMLRAGQWPQHGPDSSTNGYASSCYNQNIAVGDLDGDGRAEIIGPSDVHYITAYQDDGTQIYANAIYGTNPDSTNKFWSRVGIHVDHAVDLRGYAECGIEHRPNFAHAAPIIVDVNGDGVLEVVVTGNVYDCSVGHPPGLYEGLYIFNADRTRWSGNGFDWTVIPVPDADAAPLSESYEDIENHQSNPVAADLDGDGYMEILYASYDGRLHAYWLDKTEHGSWPYEVYNAAEGFYRFASEPVVADLDVDGYAEVIFSSWVQKGTGQTGKLHIVDYQGNVLQEVVLPPAFGAPDWNGALAAPTLANIDSDADLEVVLNTAHSGLVAYDLPGTANARVLWNTGRGSYLRYGGIIPQVHGSLVDSTKSVLPLIPVPGDRLTYTLILRNPGPDLTGVRITDTLPLQVNYLGDLWGSAGSYGVAGGMITWTGTVSAMIPITITYSVSVSGVVAPPLTIVNTVYIDDGLGTILARQATAIVNGVAVYLPLILR